jgi:16S rRNA (cytidine1402-2'-O)-methyltransferase
MPGTLFVVATPIGNLDDVTARALRVLREVDIIAAEDTRRTSHLLTRYAITTPTTSLHEHNEQKKTATLLARLGAGESIALVSDAGTPTVSDPGQRLIQAAVAAGVRVEPIPGPSAILATLAASGFPADSFLFLGFPSTRSKDRNRWFERLRVATGTVVFFEAPHRLRRTLSEIQEAMGDIEAVVGREISKIHEELVRGPISTVLSVLEEPRGEFTIALSIGQKPEITVELAGLEKAAVADFGLITELAGASRRTIVAALAKRHGLHPNQVYALLEAAKSDSLS